jgi:hypothetical protein
VQGASGEATPQAVSTPVGGIIPFVVASALSGTYQLYVVICPPAALNVVIVDGPAVYLLLVEERPLAMCTLCRFPCRSQTLCSWYQSYSSRVAPSIPQWRCLFNRAYIFISPAVHLQLWGSGCKRMQTRLAHPVHHCCLLPAPSFLTPHVNFKIWPWLQFSMR